MISDILDLCSEPRISNGQVSGRAGPNYFSGSVRCEVGLVLVGNPAIRCSAGVWGGAMPVCAGIEYSITPGGE